MTTRSVNNPCLLYHFGPANGKEDLMFTNPLEIIQAKTLEEVRPALRRVQERASEGYYAAGFIAYEAAPAFDAAFTVWSEKTNVPLVWFGIFEQPVSSLPSAASAHGAYQLGNWIPSEDEATYRQHIAVIKEAIARGETYQVNYTFHLRTSFEGDARAFYDALVEAQQAAYSAYLDLGHLKLLSVSPELFFQTVGRTITTRPMKGTIRRGRWTEEDARNAEVLRHSDKDMAENVMIVDLLRNDLGVIAKTGSVRVDRLFEVEPYPTVYQLTSTVSAELRDDVELEDIFSALFPCGSITGAPKIATMSRIAGLERAPRNAYCGAIGVIGPGGDATFNVAIRTVTLDETSGLAEYGVGGGITWDSDAGAEYREALAKSRVLVEDWKAFALLETMRLHRSEYTLFQRHVDRLMASAAYFEFPVDRQTVCHHLRQYAQTTPSNDPLRVRLLISRNGQVTLESTSLGSQTLSVQPVALASRPVDRNLPFLYHKTTHRTVYEGHRSEHPTVFDVLLWNEEDELTEFTIGNLVLQIDGQKWTPPQACGLLAGTLRAELLHLGEIKERVLTMGDLQRAEGIWLINSVRGWIPVHIVSDC